MFPRKQKLVELNPVQYDKYLKDAREVARDLGDPEPIMEAIKAMEKMKDEIDKK